MARMLDVLDRIRDLETELEHGIAAAQKQWHYRIDAGRVRFEDAVHRHHKAMKTSIRRYLQQSYLPSILSARIIYLNGIEKANCEYCGYANGVLAYIREVAARTEQYWCPIKHARRVKGLLRKALHDHK